MLGQKASNLEQEAKSGELGTTSQLSKSPTDLGATIRGKLKALEGFDFIFESVDIEAFGITPNFISIQNVDSKIEQVYDELFRQMIQKKSANNFDVVEALMRAFNKAQNSNQHAQYWQLISNLFYSVSKLTDYNEIVWFSKFILKPNGNDKLFVLLCLRHHFKDVTSIVLAQEKQIPNLTFPRAKVNKIVKKTFSANKPILDKVQQLIDGYFVGDKQINYLEFVDKILEVDYTTAAESLFHNLVDFFSKDVNKNLLKETSTPQIVRKPYALKEFDLEPEELKVDYQDKKPLITYIPKRDRTAEKEVEALKQKAAKPKPKKQVNDSEDAQKSKPKTPRSKTPNRGPNDKVNHTAKGINSSYNNKYHGVLDSKPKSKNTIDNFHNYNPDTELSLQNLKNGPSGVEIFENELEIMGNPFGPRTPIKSNAPNPNSKAPHIYEDTVEIAENPFKPRKPIRTTDDENNGLHHDKIELSQHPFGPKKKHIRVGDDKTPRKQNTVSFEDTIEIENPFKHKRPIRVGTEKSLNGKKSDLRSKSDHKDSKQNSKKHRKKSKNSSSSSSSSDSDSSDSSDDEKSAKKKKKEKEHKKKDKEDKEKKEKKEKKDKEGKEKKEKKDKEVKEKKEKKDKDGHEKKDKEAKEKKEKKDKKVKEKKDKDGKEKKDKEEKGADEKKDKKNKEGKEKKGKEGKEKKDKKDKDNKVKKEKKDKEGEKHEKDKSKNTEEEKKHKKNIKEDGDKDQTKDNDKKDKESKGKKEKGKSKDKKAKDKSEKEKKKSLESKEAIERSESKVRKSSLEKSPVGRSNSKDAGHDSQTRHSKGN